MNLNSMLMLNVGYARHDADWNFDKVNSPFTRIYYVTEGTANVIIDGTRHTLTPGHLYIIPAFTEHTDICNGIFNHYYIHIYENGATDTDITGNYDFPFELPGAPIDEIMFKNLCEHSLALSLKHSDPKIYDNKNSLIDCVRLNRERPLWERMESVAVISHLLSRFIRAAKPKLQISDERIANAIKTINTLPPAELDSIDFIARQACMSVNHFIRLFKSQVGCTPAQFIISRKMTRAKLLLASEQMSVKEIAFEIGYEDISYFNRLFKRHTGMTPGKYRYSFNRNSISVKE